MNRRTEDRIQLLHNLRNSRLVNTAAIALFVIIIGAYTYYNINQPIGLIIQSIGVVIASFTINILMQRYVANSPQVEEIRMMQNDLKADLEEFSRGREAREMGVSKIYATRGDALNDIIADLKKSKIRCRIYAAVSVPEIFEGKFEGKDDFADIIADVVSKAQPTTVKYLLTFTSLNYHAKDMSLSDDEAVVRMWSLRERDPSEHLILGRIQKAQNIFWHAVQHTANKHASILEAEARFFKNYLCPHSMFIIDDEIIYLSLYEWKHWQGVQAPTLRLTKGAWTSVFLGEADKIDNEHSTQFNKFPQTT